MASRLGVSTHSLYAWLKKYGPDAAEHQAKADDQAEIRRLQKELKRVTEERDILKKGSSKISGEGCPDFNRLLKIAAICLPSDLGENFQMSFRVAHIPIRRFCLEMSDSRRTFPATRL